MSSNTYVNRTLTSLGLVDLPSRPGDQDDLVGQIVGKLTNFLCVTEG